MHPFRAFLSYSHEDRPLVEKLAACMADGGLRPVWDMHIRPGQPFSEVLK